MLMKRSLHTHHHGAYTSAMIAALFFAVGALTAIVAWHHGLLWWLLIIPVSWGYTRGYVSVFMLMFGYFLLGAYDFPHVFKLFFSDAYDLGYGIWIFHALLLALPYALLRRYGIYGLILAMFITVLPPLGLVAWLSPLLVAGKLFPGLGILGYFACMLTFFVIAHPGQAGKRRWAVLMPLLLISAYCNANAPALANERVPLWFGQNTGYGNYPRDVIAGFERQLQLMKQVDAALNQGAKLILLPEDIVNQWLPASEYWWGKEIGMARKKKATLMIGASLYEGNGRWTDVLVIRGADTGMAKARIPVPISMWNPFVENGFNTDIAGSGIVYVQGKPVAISVCYEDLLVFPMALSFVGNYPLAILSSANNWFGAGTDEPYMQSLSIQAQARLFGVPLIRALNLPNTL